MKKILLILSVLVSFSVFGQKALVKNNVIVKVGIPDKFMREDGTFFWGGYINLPDSIHYQDGWKDIVRPEFNDTLQRLGQRYYNQAMDKVTWTVIDRELPSVAVAKERKIRELKFAVKDIYSDIQWYLEMKRMNDEQIPAIVKDKLQSIRTKYLQVVNEINSLTTIQEVLRYQLPYEQIETVKQQLEQIN